MNEIRPSIPGWIVDYVSLDGDAIYTDSRPVAEAYGKDHRNVLRDIRELIEATEDRLNFEPMSLPDGYGRMQPAYRLTRDGFLMLALGFTGQKAIRLRARFVEAFGWMARELLLRRVDDHDRRAIESRTSGSIGGSLLAKRKHELPALESEERQLKAQLQMDFEFPRRGDRA